MGNTARPAGGAYAGANPQADRRAAILLGERRFVRGAQGGGALGLGTALNWALWLGLLGGLVEVGLIALRKTLLHHFAFVTADVVWMAPATDVLLACTPTLILFVTAQWWQRAATVRSIGFTNVFVATLSPLLMYGPLHPAAAVVLAAGVASQGSRLIAAHADGFTQFVRRTRVALVAAIVALTVAVYGPRAVRERNAASASAVPPSSHINVLFVVLDTVRAQNMSLYGYSRRTTPHIERFAATGVSFEHAVSTAPWTLPSHSTMFTGRYGHELSANWMTALDRRYPTLAEVLGAHAYATAGFVGNTSYCSRETGLDRGFAHYEDYRLSPEQVLITSSLGKRIDGQLRALFGDHDLLGRLSAAEVNREFLGWLSQHPQRPFFAFLNYFDAHAPHLPPPPFDGMFGARRARGTIPVHARDFDPRSQPAGSASVTQQEIDAYDGTLAYLDEQVGRLLDELRKRGLLDHTLVVITSDHGEEFGEHGAFGHGDNLYFPTLHVPLVIALPGRVPAGIRVGRPVSLRDLPATIIDVLALAPGTGLPGASLARRWRNTEVSAVENSEPLLAELRYESTLPQWFRSHRANMTSLLLDRYQYITNKVGGEELYDWQQDPSEQHNRAGSENAEAIVQGFRTSLQSLLAANEQ